MKCHILFSGKNKKNISKCRQLKILPRVLSVKANSYFQIREKHMLWVLIRSTLWPQYGDSNKNPQHRFLCRYKKNIHTFWTKKVLSGAMQTNNLCFASKIKTVYHNTVVISEILRNNPTLTYQICKTEGKNKLKKHILQMNM